MQAISVHNLTKSFGKTRAIQNVSFDVAEGEIFGFLGPNGAGKTTTIRCMMDFIRPSSGTISIFEKDSRSQSVEIKKSIGYLSGYVRLHNAWTGNEHIAFARRLQKIHDGSEALIKRLQFDPTIKAKNLSSGNRQKLGLILALMNQPKLIIMDEPTNALDPLLQNAVYELLDEAKNRGATVFMSSHNLSEVDRVCTRVSIIKQGEIVATESIANLKKKRMYSVHAHFGKPIARESFTALGAQILESRNDYLTMKIKGDIQPYIKLLGTLPILDVKIEHATLEEIFIEYYK